MLPPRLRQVVRIRGQYKSIPGQQSRCGRAVLPCASIFAVATMIAGVAREDYAYVGWDDGPNGWGWFGRSWRSYGCRCCQAGCGSSQSLGETLIQATAPARIAENPETHVSSRGRRMRAATSTASGFRTSSRTSTRQSIHRKEHEMGRDPVCGMNVHPEAAAGSVEQDGKAYWFCTSACLKQSQDHPEPCVTA